MFESLYQKYRAWSGYNSLVFCPYTGDITLKSDNYDDFINGGLDNPKMLMTKDKKIYFKSKEISVFCKENDEILIGVSCPDREESLPPTTITLRNKSFEKVQ